MGFRVVNQLPILLSSYLLIFGVVSIVGELSGDLFSCCEVYS